MQETFNYKVPGVFPVAEGWLHLCYMRCKASVLLDD